LDGSGNVFIADAANCRVRKIAASVISTVAGNGTCGFAGDGGPTSHSDLWGPTSAKMSVTGKLYIADTANCRVRVIIAHVISTAAGNGTCGYGGDGAAAAAAPLNHPRGGTDGGTSRIPEHL